MRSRFRGSATPLLDDFSRTKLIRLVRLWFVVLVTNLLGTAGSAEALYAVASNAVSWQHYFLGFLVPAFFGNSFGGVIMVSLLNYAQSPSKATKNNLLHHDAGFAERSGKVSPRFPRW